MVKNGAYHPLNILFYARCSYSSRQTVSSVCFFSFLFFFFFFIAIVSTTFIQIENPPRDLYPFTQTHTHSFTLYFHSSCSQFTSFLPETSLYYLLIFVRLGRPQILARRTLRRLFVFFFFLLLLRYKKKKVVIKFYDLPNSTSYMSNNLVISVNDGGRVGWLVGIEISDLYDFYHFSRLHIFPRTFDTSSALVRFDRRHASRPREAVILSINNYSVTMHQVDP